MAPPVPYSPYGLCGLKATLNSNRTSTVRTSSVVNHWLDCCIRAGMQSTSIAPTASLPPASQSRLDSLIRAVNLLHGLN